MSVLALEHVSKRYRQGQRERLVLDSVSLQLDAGELVVVYGPRRSGRTTLLRIAAGIETPDSGTVSFEGHPLSGHAGQTLGEGIGYLRKTLHGNEEQGVLEQIAAPLLARGIGAGQARHRARAVLGHIDAQHCSARTVDELSSGERIRVAFARALVLAPTVLVADEPAATVEISERDGILSLLRTLSGQGVAVLASTAEPAEMAGAHRALTLGDGTLRGPATPELAPVVALRRSV
jgi:ABC-type lipoprotein export system ATPase subunit